MELVSVVFLFVCFCWVAFGVGHLCACLAAKGVCLPASFGVRFGVPSSRVEMGPLHFETSLGVDSPFFSTIVLFKDQLFPQGFGWFFRKKDGENGWTVPLEQAGLRLHKQPEGIVLPKTAVSQSCGALAAHFPALAGLRLESSQLSS